MQYFKILFIIFIFFLPLHALEKVSVQLAWKHQFEFAGFYMAKEKGFYKDVGLDVEIKEYQYGLNLTEDVINNKSTYGETGTSLLIDASLGKETKLLASIYQSSPLVFLSTKKSNISSIPDFKGKRLMTTPGADTAIAFYAMTNRHGITKDDMIYQKHSFDVKDLAQNKTDIMMAYSSNEPYLLQELGVEYNIFDPREYGFDFYNNIIFTSVEETQNHPHRAANFTEASLKGFDYAFQHIDEAVEVILTKYNSQNKSKAALLFEANALKKLAYDSNNKLGEIDPNKLQRIYDIYNATGSIKKSVNPQEMIFQKPSTLELSNEEKNYLKEKNSFNVCIQPDLFPIDGVKDGVHTGIVADIFLEISQKNGMIFTPYISKNFHEFRKNIQQKKCELISVMSVQYTDIKNYSFTQPYISTSLSLVSKITKPFVNDISSLEGKKILVEYQALKKYLLTFNKNLDISIVESQDAMVEKILEGYAECAIVPSLSAEWMIQKYGVGTLKINGIIGKERPLLGSIAVAEENLLLLKILDKTLSSIPEEKMQEIIKSWTLVNYISNTDYSLALWIAGVSLLIFLAFSYRQNLLRKNNLRLEDNVLTRTQELQKSNELLNAIFDTTRDSIAIVDKETNFLFANKAYFEMTGYSKEELYEQSCLGLSLDLDNDKIQDAFKVIETKGYLEDFEKSYTRKDGQIIDVQFNILKMADSDNFLLIANDVTQKKLLQLEKEKQEAHLLQQSRLAQMGEMISMIAHQWRQPLGSIAAKTINIKLHNELELYDFSSMQGQEEFFKFLNHELDDIDSYVQNLTTTVDDFRNFYKPNKLSVRTTFETLIQKALKIMLHSLNLHNIELSQSYSQDDGIELYENEMLQVVLNILKNAQDNFQEKKIQNPKIEIRSKNNVLYISDNGGGIPQNVLESIFDPYFSTKDEKNGTGLGLYMSKTIVEEHHKGKLLATNQNDGVCFEINLERNSER